MTTITGAAYATFGAERQRLNAEVAHVRPNRPISGRTKCPGQRLNGCVRPASDHRKPQHRDGGSQVLKSLVIRHARWPGLLLPTRREHAGDLPIHSQTHGVHGKSAAFCSLRDRQRGQSIVEFAVIVPILLVLFVAIADFGRVFAAGISVEAATRDAAEAVANEYLATPPNGDLMLAAAGSDQSLYDRLRNYAAKVVCSELRDLPNTNYDPGPPPTCPDMPVVFVCIHDGGDAGCDSKASPGSQPVPAGCTDMTPTPTNAQTTNPDGSHPRWVEVRTCYHFTNILQLPLFALGDVWVQRTRTFTIPCYFVLGTSECGG